MQPAPAVSVEWRTGSAWIVAALLLSAAALASGVLWAAGVGGLAWVLPGATVPLVAAGLWSLRPQSAQRLRWDGQSWWRASTLTSAEVRGEVQLMLDFGTHLLLRFDAAEPGLRQRRGWLALSRRATAGDWHGLRCALYSSGAEDPTPAAADSPP